MMKLLDEKEKEVGGGRPETMTSMEESGLPECFQCLRVYLFETGIGMNEKRKIWLFEEFFLKAHMLLLLWLELILILFINLIETNYKSVNDYQKWARTSVLEMVNIFYMGLFVCVTG